MAWKILETPVYLILENSLNKKGFFNAIMQCLNATTPLTKIYLSNQNFRDIPVENSVFEETKTNNVDSDGWISVSSHSKKPKKNKGYKENQKNKSTSTTLETANINKKFQEFLLDARRNKNKCFDPSPLFKSISNLSNFQKINHLCFFKVFKI